MLNLLLTRHGTTTVGDNVMLGGQLDVPLSDQGRREAEALAARLSGVRIDRIISSPMARALETAQVIARGRPVEVDDRLRELDYGLWEGLDYAEIDARDPELRARWEADPASTCSPGGECGNDVAERARSFLASLLAVELMVGTASARSAQAVHRSPDAGGSRHLPAEDSDESVAERRVLLVAHGTFNRILMCAALDVPIRDYRRRFVMDRAGLSLIRYEAGDGPDGAQLVLANDVAHLRKPGQPPWG
jgi:broad specificity phosphatase PhoE